MAAFQPYRSPFGDTTYTKVFVGGLAWETQTEEMRRYFEQFGDILEAVIIIDKNTGRSKGYGFVTFRDPESARRACVEANPMIDGRRANCNIASFGRPRTSPPRGRNQGGTHYRGVAPMGATSYNRVGGPLLSPPPPPPPPPTLPPQVVYPPYGYTTYAPDYGYAQTMYSPHLQAQYYHQMYGTSTSSMGMGNSSYYYGYALPAAAATQAPPRLTFSATQLQRMVGSSSFTLPTTTTTALEEGSFITNTTTTSRALQAPSPSRPPVSDSQITQQQSSETAGVGPASSEVEDEHVQGKS